MDQIIYKSKNHKIQRKSASSDSVWSGDQYVAVKWEGMGRLYLPCIQQCTDNGKDIGFLLGITANNTVQSWLHNYKIEVMSKS